MRHHLEAWKATMIDPMFSQYASWIPFASLAIGDQRMAKPAVTEYVEKFLIAGVTALVTVYANDKKQDAEMALMREQNRAQYEQLVKQIWESDTRTQAQITELRKFLLERR